ncbi:hypothetical protein FSP39_004602 [Pinctada imbricata]|uniref:Uncharacterized protein n=1 Tax=Pinctada imbricata TaxID=66713 RepID=A0AA88YBZ2_PINIB|nr:hypothetical protein FSP39_004602 [Pinctada imbricata]
MNRTVSANCNNLNLTAVPNNLPISLASLSLSYNSIAIIENEDFYNLTFILHLDLSYNKLRFLQPNSFIRCQELRTLDLSHNDLFVNSTSLPMEIFQHLKRLQSLSLHGNAYPFFDYPDYFLGKLHLLEILRMDGIPVNFGAEFSNIENLRELHLNGNDGICILGNVTQDTFRSLNTTKLAVLDVTHCHIETVSKYAFSMLIHLSKLVLYEFKSGLSNLQNALTGLDMTNIAELYTSKIYKKPIPVTLNDEFRPLMNTSIQKLYITDSHLYDIRPEFIELLPRTIQELSFRDNIISKAKFLQKMSMLNSLIKVDISFQRQYTMTDQITASSVFGIVQSHDDDVRLPPNLQIFVASHLKLGYGFVQGTSFKPNILRFLDLSCNELEVLGRRVGWTSQPPGPQFIS